MDKAKPEVWEYVLGRSFTGKSYAIAITKEEFIKNSAI